MFRTLAFSRSDPPGILNGATNGSKHSQQLFTRGLWIEHGHAAMSTAPGGSPRQPVSIHSPHANQCMCPAARPAGTRYRSCVDTAGGQWLGYRNTSRDWVEADGNPGLHANWPYYPAPPGELNALLDLCQYPRGTVFLVVDDIDRVLLLLAERYRVREDDYHDDNFYAAAWHQDLQQLQDEDLAEGLEWGMEAQWRYARWSRVTSGLPSAEVFTALPDGTYIAIPPPPLPQPDEDDDYGFLNDNTWPLLRAGADHVTVSAAGWAKVQDHLRDALTLHPDLERVSTLLKLGLTDTAVREAAVTLESMLRRRLHTSKFGMKLAALVTARMQQTGLDEAHQLIVSTRLRTIFKFVRNEFAHNVHRELSVIEANALCWRIATLYDNPLWDQLSTLQHNVDC